MVFLLFDVSMLYCIVVNSPNIVLMIVIGGNVYSDEAVTGLRQVPRHYVWQFGNRTILNVSPVGVGCNCFVPNVPDAINWLYTHNYMLRNNFYNYTQQYNWGNSIYTWYPVQVHLHNTLNKDGTVHYSLYFKASIGMSYIGMYFV